MRGLPCLSSWKFWKALDVVCILLKSGTYWLKLSLLENEFVVLTFEHESFFVLSVLVESTFSVVLLESSSDEFQSIAWDCDSLKYYVLWYIEVIAFSSNHIMSNFNCTHKAYYSKLHITCRVLYLMIHRIYARYLVVNFYQSIFDPTLFGIDQPRNPTFWWHLNSILHPGDWWMENLDGSFVKSIKIYNKWCT